MTRWAESPGPAREHDEPFLGAVGTPDAGESAFRVAAIKIALDHRLDDRPKKTVRPLEAALIFRQEALEIMKKHPVEDRALRMPGTIDSRHGGRKASRTGPTSPMNPDLPENKRMTTSNGQFWPGKREPAWTLDPKNGNGSRLYKVRRTVSLLYPLSASNHANNADGWNRTLHFKPRKPIESSVSF